jgi:predicted nuclease of predicted toxin-antitoxin system
VKVLCDVHIAKKVVKFFQDQGINSIHINDILDSWYTTDDNISKYADDNDFIVMTKDADFKNSHFLKKTPKKLLKISLGNISTKKLISLIDNNLHLLKEKFEKDFCYIEISGDTIVIIEE